ncbi:MAG: hypothetical protein JW801_02275 [Bacteroidales bacterium]|nr:hypothetical protein [Bacteroidales bacterium]
MRFEKTKTDVDYWIRRAAIFHLVFDFQVDFIESGIQEIEFDTLSSDPLKDVYESLGNAMVLDANALRSGDITILYNQLKNDYERLALLRYDAGDYPNSFTAFSMIDSINQSPLLKGAVNDTLLFNTALVASKAGFYDKSIEYYEKALDAGYSDPNTYIYLYRAYLNAGDIRKGSQALRNGSKQFPDEKSILVEMLNYYLQYDSSGDSAIQCLALAQEKDPGNVALYFAEGTLYEMRGVTEHALESYRKCIDMDPGYFDAYYNMAVMFFNQAVDLYTQADSAGDDSTYEVLIAEAREFLKKSLSYSEKAKEIRPDEPGMNEIIRKIEYKLN